MLASTSRELKERLNFILKELNFSLEKHTENPKDTLIEFKTINPRVLILDLFLKDSNGFELVKKLKEMNETAPIIVISPIRSPSLIEKLFRYGAKDVLIPPFSNETLATTILHRIEE